MNRSSLLHSIFLPESLDQFIFIFILYFYLYLFIFFQINCYKPDCFYYSPGTIYNNGIFIIGAANPRSQ